MPQLVAGRYITAELCGGLDDISLPQGLYGPSTKDDSETPSELVDLVFGHSPPLDIFTAIENWPIARCAQIEPLPDTLQSPPEHERGQYPTSADDPWYDSPPHYEPEQPHITGVAVTSSGICGNPNLVSRGDRIIC